MEQIYTFRDWTSAVRMKNKLNSAYKIEVSIPADGKSQGYGIIVYNTLTNVIVYSFRVDDPTEGVWSLSTSEAVEVLNKIGFPCEYQRGHGDIKPEVINFLRNLNSLGYKTISREHDGQLSIRKDGDYAWTYLRKPEDFSNCSKFDFWFLPVGPSSIGYVVHLYDNEELLEKVGDPEE